MNTYIIKVTHDGKFVREKYDEDDSLGSIQYAVGGYIELLASNIPEIDGISVDIYVDDEGLLKDLPFNPTVSRLSKYGEYIVGDAAIVKVDEETGENTGLTDDECAIIENYIKRRRK